MPPFAQSEAASPEAAAQHVIPFQVGSNLYREPAFFTDTQQLDGNPHEFIHSITPGNFLSGITLQVTSTGGVLGTTAALAGDAPFSIFSSITLEDISGGSIGFSMSGFAYYTVQKYLQPWLGDPTKKPDFSNTINPAFTLAIHPEIRDTLACLSNTDARAQYRLRYTLAPGVQSGQFGLTSVGTGVTFPTCTVKGYLNAWAQPDNFDLLGNPIEPTPAGMAASRFVMHELPAIQTGNNVVRATLMGNELRGVILIVRNGDATKTRQNLTDANTGGIEARLDQRRLWKMTPSQIVEEMTRVYPFIGAGTQTRDAGVYVIPRYRLPGSLQGEYWLQTVEQTLMQLEFNGSDLTTSPGTLELIYDALAIAGELPAELEGI